MNSVKPLTYLITKGEATPENFKQRCREILKTVDAAVRFGISMIQIRERSITAKQSFELIRNCVAAVAGSQTKLLVNGRADIALIACADGVQLPEDGVPVAKVRRGFPRPFLIGASVHSLENARQAQTDGADFVLFGPVFDSGEKKGKGIGELEAVCTELRDFPVIGVGGIDRSNCAHVLDAGTAGYAAIRYLNQRVFEA